MYNPSYLVQSRHNVYYFRYPLPVKPQRRVCVSLGTRCPREALRLAKMLEYHGLRIIEELNCQTMDYIELKTILKDQFAKLLKAKKLTMNEFGPLPHDEVIKLEKSIELVDMMIEKDIDDFDSISTPNKPQEERDIHKAVMNLSEVYELNLHQGSDEYRLVNKQYKYALKGLYQDILSYHRQLSDFSKLDESQPTQTKTAKHLKKSEYYLSTVIERHMQEDLSRQVEESTLDDKRNCLQYLIDYFGADCPINRIEAEQAREVRHALFQTPIRRNIIPKAKGLPLHEQIKIAEEQKLQKFSETNVKKYLLYFKGLFNWAVELKYIEDNPFAGMKVSGSKKQNRYNAFDNDQIKIMLNELDKGSKGLAKTDSAYWGTLIAIYTGARRNEVASLLPTDIKKDDKTGIWYFDITDEEETKKLKTGAAKRIVPIHSELLDRGILEFVDRAKKKKPSPKHKDYTPRLLYDMTFHKKEKWGRNLGRFVNERFLPELNLKGEKYVLHSLRHSFITYLSSKGVNAKDIKSMVGHEQDTVTFGIYAHFGVEHLEQFKEAIEKLPY